jgi:hypothetical protein
MSFLGEIIEKARAVRIDDFLQGERGIGRRGNSIDR